MLAAGLLAVTPGIASAGGAGGLDGGVEAGGGADVTGTVTYQQVQQVQGGSGPAQASLMNGRPTELEVLQARIRASVAEQNCRRVTLRLETATKNKDAADAAANQSYLDQNCKPGATAGTIAPPAWVLGTQAVAQMNLPAAPPAVGPDPSLNEWNMAGVGYPLWLSVPGAVTQNATASVQGYAVTLAARRTSVNFTMGDGGSVDCATSTPWSLSVTPGDASPDCGYTYTKASKPGQYRIVATTNWEVTWSVLGESGVIPVTKLGGTDLTVGELEAVVTSSGNS
ncbi:Tat pathway signal sequence [Luteococcus sp.]|uniref:Tat pathway signal sequence n=1 Tax=Luteococcus sp. TaxID=1969402 RepID=UPI003736ADF7